MAADWRGWRLIVVNGERYRWQYTYITNGCGFVSVRAESRPSRLLVDYGCRGKPGEVRLCIEGALARGWPRTEPDVVLQ